jgi:hypothetical protein
MPLPDVLIPLISRLRAALTKTFKSAKIDRLEDILETLASLGQAHALRDGRYVAL